ncbi:MAG: trypsin-like peptidase domain-containing protein [Eubacteriales bacterium]|nr:trypsin-like peptidase domain-containing protein [Eubacteriales bacterium]
MSWYNSDNDNSNWYKPLETESNWTSYGPHGPMGASGEEYGTADLPRKDKKRQSIRLIGCAVLALLLVGAFVYSRIMDFNPAPSFPEGPEYDPSLEIPAGDYPDSFSDFFDSFFTQVETVPAEVRIEKYTSELSFELSLEQEKGKELSLGELYSECADSVVSIKGYVDESAGYNWGTGVVLTADGLILTNTHVIDGCDSAEVIDSAGQTFDAKLVGADSISDLAVLKVEASGLHPAVFGESAGLTVGESVAAIGNPLGDTFTGTLTNGIISAIDRDVTYNGRSMTLMQTNTALNEGNSGGPLFNMYGQVIGITNMKMMSTFSSIEGIGFAIPSSTVKNVVNSIVSFGEVRGRPSIGITVGQIPANVALHYEMPEGLYVSAVSEGSDAEKKGIVPGDVVTKVDGIPVVDTNQVNDMKNTKSVGDTMLFTIWRSGEESEIEVSLVDTNDIYR